MQTEEDYIAYVVGFLKRHECRLLSTMPLEEVFDAANMSFLVSWAFCLWHKDLFETMLQSRQQDKAFVADLLDSYGFCTDLEEAHSFLNAEQPPEEQIFIIYSMFKFMEHSIKVKPGDEDLKKSITDEDLDALHNLDVNLFPEFGAVTSLTDEERHEKLKVISDESDKLAVENNTETFLSCQLQQSNVDLFNIDESLGRFRHLMTHFKPCLATNNEPEIAIGASFTDTLRKCNTTIKYLTEHLDALRTIEEFKIEKLELPEDQATQFVRALYQQLLEKKEG